VEQNQNKSGQEPQGKGQDNKTNVIRIDLGQRYSQNLWIHLVASFLVNFLVLVTVLQWFQLAETVNLYLYLPIAAVFTMYEEVLRHYLIKHKTKIVLYSAGLIFFLVNLLYFYLVDLFIYPRSFNFSDSLYPLYFVILFQLFRMIVKNLYRFAVIRLNKSVAKRRDAGGSSRE
jgi:hypothetical protein